MSWSRYDGPTLGTHAPRHTTCWETQCPNSDMRLIHIVIKYPPGRADSSLGLSMRGGLAALIPCRLACRAGSNLIAYLLGVGCPSVILSAFLDLNIIRCRPERSTRYQRTATVGSQLLVDQFVSQRSLKLAPIRCVFVYVVLFACLPGFPSLFPTSCLSQTFPHSSRSSLRVTLGLRC